MLKHGGAYGEYCGADHDGYACNAKLIPMAVIRARMPMSVVTALMAAMLAMSMVVSVAMAIPAALEVALQAITSQLCNFVI